MSLGAMPVGKALSIQTSLCFYSAVFLKQAVALKLYHADGQLLLADVFH